MTNKTFERGGVEIPALKLCAFLAALHTACGANYSTTYELFWAQQSDKDLKNILKELHDGVWALYLPFIRGRFITKEDVEPFRKVET